MSRAATGRPANANSERVKQKRYRNKPLAARKRARKPLPPLLTCSPSVRSFFACEPVRPRTDASGRIETRWSSQSRREGSCEKISTKRRNEPIKTKTGHTQRAARLGCCGLRSEGGQVGAVLLSTPTSPAAGLVVWELARAFPGATFLFSFFTSSSWLGLSRGKQGDRNAVGLSGPACAVVVCLCLPATQTIRREVVSIPAVFVLVHVNDDDDVKARRGACVQRSLCQGRLATWVLRSLTERPNVVFFGSLSAPDFERLSTRGVAAATAA